MLNFLFLFYEKILYEPKAPKSTKKHQKTPKKTQKRNQAKAQNANKQTKIKKHLSGKK